MKKKRALVLGGGGARGAYQIGAWQAFRELNISFDIVAGTSVGAINGALMIGGDFNVALELWKKLDTPMVFDIELEGHEGDDVGIGGIPAKEALSFVKRIMTNGGAEASGLLTLLRSTVNESKVRNSNIDYGLVVVSLPLLRPETLFTENIPAGQLHDFIMASSSAYPAVKYYEIEKNKYIDGSYYDVLPTGAAMNRGATEMTVVNLHGAGVLRKGDLTKAATNMDKFTMIKSPRNLGSILTFDQGNTSRILRLGYLDTLKAFGKCDGRLFAYSKNLFKSKELLEMDTIGDIFDLEVEPIYDKKSFEKALYPHIKSALLTYSKMKTAIDEKRNFSVFFTEKYDDKLLTVVIAHSLKIKGEESAFLSRKALRAFRNQIFAARYLLRSGWMDSGL